MKTTFLKDWCLRMAHWGGDEAIGAGPAAADPVVEGFMTYDQYLTEVVGIVARGVAMPLDETARLVGDVHDEFREGLSVAEMADGILHAAASQW